MTELLTACADRLSEFTHALHFDAIPHEVAAALTGIGTAYFDDLKIEPLIGK